MAVWKRVALAFGAFFIAVGLLVALIYWAVSGVAEPIEHQFAALNRGDMAAAYADMSAEYRGSTSLSQFEDFVRRNPALSRNASHSFSNRSVNSDGKKTTGAVRGTLTDASGGVVPVEYRLVKEGDVWRILSIRFGAQGNEKAI